MTLYARTFVYGMVIPGILGLGVLAAVVIPGADLSLPRLLLGCAGMIVVQIVGGFLGGRAAGRHA